MIAQAVVIKLGEIQMYISTIYTALNIDAEKQLEQVMYGHSPESFAIRFRLGIYLLD